MWRVIATWPFSQPGVQEAARFLKDGSCVLDALEHGICAVEDDPTVDSVGFGSFPNQDGQLELDAAMMDGDTMRLGAVAALQGTKNPIRVARAVMEKTQHTMLVGAGAQAFAQAQGFEQVDMLTQEIREKWEKRKKEETGCFGHDTVGMVTLRDGHMAAGTSTSGTAMKIPGRVGDSPLIGSGFYVDNLVGGATATGWGEDIMRGCTSYAAVEYMREGYSAQEAAEKAVARTHRLIASKGKKPENIAVVCMDKQGRFGAAANHENFAYVAAGDHDPVTVHPVTPLKL
ncbi:MAG TPA: N(4)-(beta-N-acetylglucosaminyl)-L-asparaginase [Candidatus Gallacutalibacter stercoravium]|nr:N(4)-(beta-N-acetylglucosaminyl)-L-asparaginase [Candidatus Gallacutalibacter stercoravium]